VGPGLASSGQSNIDVLPAEALNATTNTLSHLFLMGFMVSLGYKLAMLGVNLVRPVVVRIEGKRLNGQTQEK
jgi:hypothetical protein